MPGATRQGVDICGGLIISGSNNVYTNGAGAVRIGDRVGFHGKKQHSASIMISGSPNVFVNGIPACREGDVAICGHRATGSNNVFIN